MRPLALLLCLALHLLTTLAVIAQDTEDLRFEVRADEPVGPCDHGLWANMGYDPLYAATTSEPAIHFWRRIRETGAIRAGVRDLHCLARRSPCAPRAESAGPRRRRGGGCA